MQMRAQMMIEMILQSDSSTDKDTTLGGAVKFV